LTDNNAPRKCVAALVLKSLTGPA